MTKFLKKYALLAVSAFAFASPALAATIVNIPNPTADLSEKVHANSAGAGNALVLKTMPSGYFINYSSTGLPIDVGNGNGFAQATGVGNPNTSGFDNLTINLQNIANPTLGASAIHFKIDGLDIGQGRNRSVAKSFDVTVNFVGGGSQLLATNLFVPNDKFLVTAGLGEVISGLTFSNSLAANGNPTDFRSLKQVSFAAVLPPAVPEPAAWGLMLAGFGMAGAAVRRRNNRVAVVTA